MGIVLHCQGSRIGRVLKAWTLMVDWNLLLTRIPALSTEGSGIHEDFLQLTLFGSWIDIEKLGSVEGEPVLENRKQEGSLRNKLCVGKSLVKTSCFQLETPSKDVLSGGNGVDGMLISSYNNIRRVDDDQTYQQV